MDSQTPATRARRVQKEGEGGVGSSVKKNRQERYVERWVISERKKTRERKRGKRRGRNDGAGVKRNRRIDKRNVGNNWQFARRTFS